MAPPSFPRRPRLDAPGFRSGARLLGALAALLVLGAASPAQAFEREWHLGGGLGAALPPLYVIGPALNVYGAYGLTDAFDARLELGLSVHDRSGPPAWYYSAKGAFTYKLDVIQWIPWAGVSGGVLMLAKGDWPLESVQGTVGGIAGLDYAWNRNFGLGLCFSADYLFQDAAVYGAGFLRAEYHFGW